MAKTRIKTTPTRMQKEALTASTAVNPTNNNRIITEHVLKKRICALNNSMLNKEAIPLQSTIIVQPPKRTNSISSVTSTISHTSDGHCSSIESPPPTNSSSSGSGNGNCSSSTATTPTNSSGPTMDELTENAIKTLNAGLLAKTNALALKNRKVYMITEKCDDSSSSLGGSSHMGVAGGGNGGTGCAGKAGGGQKRKMYLIMEEKETPDKCGDGQMEKFMKSESNNGNKKLTLFTDTTNGQLPQKIEKILPEILSCIQAKGAAAVAGGGGGGGNCINSLASMTSAGSHAGTGATNARLISQDANGKVGATTTTTTTTTSSSSANDNETPKIRLKTDKDNNERLPLTLPPKKNRTKIITTQIIPVNNHYHPPTVSPQLVPPNSNTGDVMTTSSPSSELRNNAVVTAAAVQITQTTNGSSSSNSSSYVRADKSSATPVIVNATTLLMANGTNGFSSSKENGNKFSTSSASSASPSPQLHKNINLSTDFLFLMKMLPKLESIAEPHKSYVKACIEDLINQYAPPSVGDH